MASWAAAIERFYLLAGAHGLTDATPVHLAGGLLRLSDRLLPRLRDALRARRLAPPLQVSLCHAGGGNANLLGAARLAIRCFAAAAAGI